MIKIGTTTDLKARIMTLQMHCPIQLEVLLTVPGGRSQERQYHQRFASARMHGEWFRASAELLAFIDSRRGVGPMRGRWRDGRPANAVALEMELAEPDPAPIAPPVVKQPQPAIPAPPLEPLDIQKFVQPMMQAPRMSRRVVLRWLRGERRGTESTKLWLEKCAKRVGVPDVLVVDAAVRSEVS